MITKFPEQASTIAAHNFDNAVRHEQALTTINKTRKLISQLALIADFPTNEVIHSQQRHISARDDVKELSWYAIARLCIATTCAERI
jgi:hypothetical protein